MSKSKTELEQELRDLELRRVAIQAEIEAAENDPNKPKVLRMEFFNQMEPGDRMAYVRAGGKLID